MWFHSRKSDEDVPCKKPKTNFEYCCQSIVNMAQVIDIIKCGWTKEEIVEWLQSEAKVSMDEEIKWLSWGNGKEWDRIQCPMLGDEWVMTYYPEDHPVFYSYTAPFVMDGEVYYYRFDHDEGCWDENIQFGLGEYEEGNIYRFG